MFFPDVNKVYYLTQHCLFFIESGNGGIQVDFENYYDWANKAIFLEKGQYIKFLSDDFKVKKVEFPNNGVFEDKESRVLFKHLVSLGHIDLTSNMNSAAELKGLGSIDNHQELVERASRQWFLQNPFKATLKEYELIFDVKELIDSKYDRQINLAELTSFAIGSGSRPQSLLKEKVGVSIKDLWSRKRWAESRKKVALTNNSIQEISYTMGYNDPGYFNKVFKQKAGVTPNEFRQDFDYDNRDTFAQDLLELVRNHHKEQRQLPFYAEQMHISVKTLQKRAKTKLGDSLGKLIRQELINSSKQLLVEDASIKETAFALGFEEPNHFTSFFKRYTGVNPTSFKNEIYN